MSDERFKCGDVVVIRSGGPPMTVMIPNRGDGLVECRWFVGDELRADAFEPLELSDYNAILKYMASAKIAAKDG